MTRKGPFVVRVAVFFELFFPASQPCAAGSRNSNMSSADAAIPQAIPKRDHQSANDSSSTRTTSNENAPQPSTDGLCGVGIILQPMPTGEYKIKGLAPNSPAAACGALQVKYFAFLLKGSSTFSSFTS